MSDKRKNLVFRLQLTLILVFFVGFLIWANTKCTSIREDYRNKLEAEKTALAQEEKAKLEKARADSLRLDSLRQLNAQGSTVAGSKETVLFVTIAGLKVRTGPSLDSTVLEELPLYAEVRFLNEVSDSTMELNLGREVADEPWVKIRTQKGHAGWVYGAGVHYYKTKHPGAF